MPWWAVGLLLTGGGWVLVNGTVYFYFEYLGDLVRAHPNPSTELIHRVSADGGARVFAAVFGWLYGPVYSVPFFLIFGVSYSLRRRDGSRNASDSEAKGE
jgi:hypothetical protein